MTTEEFLELMCADLEFDISDSKRRIYDGLTLMAKYDQIVDIGSAEHDEIWADVTIMDLAENISVEDVMELRRLGWFIDEDALAHYV
jgi:hypothetical protein